MYITYPEDLSNRVYAEEKAKRDLINFNVAVESGQPKIPACIPRRTLMQFRKASCGRFCICCVHEKLRLAAITSHKVLS
jgi:hypothetical protein